MNISITNLQRAVPVPSTQINFIAQKSARTLKLKHPELSLVFVGEQRMRSMNRTYLGHDYVTDVITFDHGEIVICPAVAARNARSYGNTVAKELALYVVHGILHLAGYDDHKPADIARMRAKEKELMGGLSSLRKRGSSVLDSR